MKPMYNELVEKRIPKPTVCGLLCQGENLKTYVMDMPSPHTYRMVKLSSVTLCKNVEELHLLSQWCSTCYLQSEHSHLQCNHSHLQCNPSVWSPSTANLNQLRNKSWNVTKAEDCIITANNSMHRPPHNPPESWLSYSFCQLSRSNKKRKHDD